MRINKKVIKIKNPETGEWESIPTLMILNIDYDSLLAFDTNEIIRILNYVDSDNNIILDDNLPSGIYILKYEFEDGTLTDIGEFTIEGVDD